MTVGLSGPAWARDGMGLRKGRYPLAVEAAVMGAVDSLLPGLSTQTKYVRYQALYGAIAAHAEAEGLDEARCRRLVRRCEVLMAAMQSAGVSSGVGGPEWSAHGLDDARRHCGPTAVDLASAADEENLRKSYSPREWGFWAQYRGPAVVLGVVKRTDGALRPGRHACPPAVRDLFAPLLELAERDTVASSELDTAGRAALGVLCEGEREWLTSLITATRHGAHLPEDWLPSDRTRRATTRVLGRAVDLHGADGDDAEETLRSAVAFGPELADDPVLAGIPEAGGWRGLLLRQYFANAWRRLWSALVDEVGDGDRSALELRNWLAETVEKEAGGVTLRETLAALPQLWDAAGHPLPAERQILAGFSTAPKDTPVADVLLLLVGGLRSREGRLQGDARAVFARRAHRRGALLDPLWVDGRIRDHLDRPVRDFAAVLVDDMLAQSRRVAVANLTYDRATGRLVSSSRLHMRNERYFRTGPESAVDIGTRIVQLAFFAEQLGLFEVQDECYALTPGGRTALDLCR